MHKSFPGHNELGISPHMHLFILQDLSADLLHIFMDFSADLRYLYLGILATFKINWKHRKHDGDANADSRSQVDQDRSKNAWTTS